MPNGYASLLATAQTDGTALTNTTTGASIIPAAAKYRIPGNAPLVSQVGRRMRITAGGRISTVVTTPGTLTFEFRLGPTANIIAATSPAFALNVVAKVNVTWRLEWDFVLRAVGATANLMHMGAWMSEAVIGAPAASAGGAPALLIPASAPAVGTNFDSTVENVSDLQAKWSVANAANSIQVHQYDLWDLGP